jgi:hypothetical protein
MDDLGGMPGIGNTFQGVEATKLQTVTMIQWTNPVLSTAGWCPPGCSVPGVTPTKFRKESSETLTKMVIINSPVVPVGLSSSTSHDDFLGLKELVTEPNRAETGTANFWVQFWQLLLAGQWPTFSLMPEAAGWAIFTLLAFWCILEFGPQSWNFEQ